MVRSQLQCSPDISRGRVIITGYIQRMHLYLIGTGQKSFLGYGAEEDFNFHTSQIWVPSPGIWPIAVYTIWGLAKLAPALTFALCELGTALLLIGIM